MIGYNGWTFIRIDRCARRDGTRPNSGQVSACVQATSQKQVAALLGESTHFVANYWSKCLNASMVEALAQHPPGTMLVRGDTGVTIDGREGWVPR